MDHKHLDRVRGPGVAPRCGWPLRRLAYRVSLRTREIGLRMALGATRLNVFRGVVGSALAIVVVGVAIGEVFTTGTDRHRRVGTGEHRRDTRIHPCHCGAHLDCDRRYRELRASRAGCAARSIRGPSGRVGKQKVERYLVSELCHIPPETLGQHRHLRGHAEADRCCGKSLIGSALVRFGVRQHARADSISKRAPSTTRTSLRLESTTCERSGTV